MEELVFLQKKLQLNYEQNWSPCCKLAHPCPEDGISLIYVDYDSSALTTKNILTKVSKKNENKNNLFVQEATKLID